jgi:hypothetical protein
MCGQGAVGTGDKGCARVVSRLKPRVKQQNAMSQSMVSRWSLRGRVCANRPVDGSQGGMKSKRVERVKGAGAVGAGHSRAPF